MGRLGRKKRGNDVDFDTGILKKKRTTTNKDDIPLNITKIVKKTQPDITIVSDQENVEPEKQSVDERVEKEREDYEQEQLIQEQLELEQFGQEQLALELEQERIEKEQLALELEKERIEKERIEKERIEKEQLEKEQLEQEQLALELEQERIEKEQKEKEKEKEKKKQLEKEENKKDETDGLEVVEETQDSEADKINEQLRLDEELAKLLAKENEYSEYEIEKIVNHTIFKGKVVQYEIKWKNYPDDDNTLEIANEIHNDVPALCEKYWDDLNIKRPTNAPGYNKPTDVDRKKAPSTSKAKTLPLKPALKKTVPIKEKKRPKTDFVSMLDVPRCMAQKGYAFPITHPNKNTQWSEEIKEIETIQVSPIDDTVILVYLEWKNGQKTIHTLKEIHEKCPKNLIEYYEERLKFV